MTEREYQLELFNEGQPKASPTVVEEKDHSDLSYRPCQTSTAKSEFNKNSEDIKRLLTLHQKEGGKGRGRRRGLEVLNKSAIVLITAFWEAYCEDVLSEALMVMIENAESAEVLPKEIRNRLATELKGEKNHLAVWKLSGDGWKKVIVERFEGMKEQRDRKLNTPKTSQIDDLFLSGLGFKKLSQSWIIAPGKSASWASNKLDYYVALRGAIAHRGSDLSSVTKRQVDNYFSVIDRIVDRTEAAVAAHVENTTKTKPW